MLAKTAQDSRRDWDRRLPYVLFAYRACCQESTQESPFFLVYGRDPKLPTPAVLDPKRTRATTDLREYGIELHSRMSAAWELARRNISRAQKRQKTAYDRRSRPSRFQEGERVFLFKPAVKSGQARKFARPFYGPYRIVEVDNNTAKICRVDRPDEEPILVALERLRTCPEEVGDECWPPAKTARRTRTKQTGGNATVSTAGLASQLATEAPDPGSMGGSQEEGIPEDATVTGVQDEIKASTGCAPSQQDTRRPLAEGLQWKGRLRGNRRPPARLCAEDGCS